MGAMSTVDWTAVSVEVLEELAKARKRFPPMQSAHEGWAILKEEVDELWEEVRGNKRDMSTYLAACRKEAVQCAAMALAFIIEICDEGRAQLPRAWEDMVE